MTSREMFLLQAGALVGGALQADRVEEFDLVDDMRLLCSSGLYADLADPHEFVLTDSGWELAMAYEPLARDAR